MATKEELERVHDAFVIPESGKLFHFQANKAASTPAERLGDFDSPPVELSPRMEGYRKAVNLARLGTANAPRGPALAVLPRKPDPATSQVCCYLVNGQNVRAVNAWTAPAWSSEPTDDDRSLSGHVADPKGLDILVADASLTVTRIRQVGNAVEAEPVALGLEGELVSQLRNGLIAGTVRLSTNEVLPVVNVAGLGATT